jgi:hypothetical protein
MFSVLEARVILTRPDPKPDIHITKFILRLRRGVPGGTYSVARVGYCSSGQTLPSEAVLTFLRTFKGDWGADQWHADVNMKNMQYIIAEDCGLLIRALLTTVKSEPFRRI